MNKKEKVQCHAIIHLASGTNGVVGAGLAQLPTADSIPIITVQVTMIISLGKVFGEKISKSFAKAMVMGFAAGYAGRTISQITIGWFPGYGNIINLSTAATLTEAMGWYVANRFSKGQNAQDVYREIKREKNSTTDNSYNQEQSVYMDNIQDDEVLSEVQFINDVSDEELKEDIIVE